MVGADQAAKISWKLKGRCALVQRHRRKMQFGEQYALGRRFAVYGSCIF
jgi:hypothetical protein